MDAPGPQYDLFERLEEEATPAPKRPPEPTACYWDHCPNCGARLHNVRCRYRCPRCHYFMSCSDFD